MVDSKVLKLGAVLKWGEEEVSDEAMEAVDLARPCFWEVCLQRQKKKKKKKGS